MGATAAPIAGLPRCLRWWEEICATLNVSLAFQLEAALLTEDMLRQAWAACMQEFPYLRCVIRPGQSPLPPQQRLFHENTQAIPQVSSERSKWGPADVTPRLVKFANQGRDHTKAVAYLHLISEGSKHLLLTTMNHAGMDATCCFLMHHSLLSNLACCQTGKPIPSRPTRSFVDICGRMPADVNTSSQPVIPAKFMPLLTPAKSEPGQRCLTEAVLTEFTSEFTSRLIERCRAHGATVQGAVSAASAVAMAKLQATQHPLPVDMLLQCPASLRKQVSPPVDNEDCACGASFLWWSQRLQPNHNIWVVAKTATECVKRESAAHGGVTFWARMLAHKHLYEIFAPGATSVPYTPPFTVTSSSVGVNPIESRYGGISVQSVHMMLSRYDCTPPNEAGMMTHAHTFGGRLHTTFTFYVPAVGYDRGKKFSEIQTAVLEAFGEEEERTVGSFIK